MTRPLRRSRVQAHDSRSFKLRGACTALQGTTAEFLRGCLRPCRITSLAEAFSGFNSISNVVQITLFTFTFFRRLFICNSELNFDFNLSELKWACLTSKRGKVDPSFQVTVPRNYTSESIAINPEMVCPPTPKLSRPTLAYLLYIQRFPSHQSETPVLAITDHTIDHKTTSLSRERARV